MERIQSETGPFCGLRVLELTSYLAAPAAAGLLAELGAKVIKVEPPGTGDSFRQTDPSTRGGVPTPPGSIHNPSFEQANRGKMSAAINLRTIEGQEAVHRLAAWADVLVTNLLPNRQKKYRLRYQDLESANPKLIYVSITGFGLKGPERDRPGFDVSAFWARSGLQGTIGDSEGPPVIQPLGIGDHTGALAMVAAIGAALYERERSGLGQEIECSLLSAGMWVHEMALLASIRAKAAIRKTSRLEAINPIMNSYRCADDKWLQLVLIPSDKFWEPLCRMVGMEELLEDPRFANDQLRTDNNRELIGLLDQAFVTKPREVWARKLDDLGAYWTPVQTLDEIPDDPQVKANEYLVPVDFPGGEQMALVRAPMKFSRTYPNLKDPAPNLGADTESALQEVGYSTEDIELLKGKGAIGV